MNAGPRSEGGDGPREPTTREEAFERGRRGVTLGVIFNSLPEKWAGE